MDQPRKLARPEAPGLTSLYSRGISLEWKPFSSSSHNPSCTRSLATIIVVRSRSRKSPASSATDALSITTRSGRVVPTLPQRVQGGCDGWPGSSWPGSRAVPLEFQPAWGAMFALLVVQARLLEKEGPSLPDRRRRHGPERSRDRAIRHLQRHPSRFPRVARGPFLEERERLRATAAGLLP